jgi:hypothetical protein
MSGMEIRKKVSKTFNIACDVLLLLFFLIKPIKTLFRMFFYLNWECVFSNYFNYIEALASKFCEELSQKFLIQERKNWCKFVFFGENCMVLKKNFHWEEAF